MVREPLINLVPFPPPGHTTQKLRKLPRGASARPNDGNYSKDLTPFLLPKPEGKLVGPAQLYEGDDDGNVGDFFVLFLGKRNLEL